MSILVNRNTRLLCQGITGKSGAFHARQMLQYGTNLVAGVVPGKGGTTFEDTNVPVFDTVEQAVAGTGANASVVFVPPPFAADSILECIDANLDLCVAITEGIPVNDMISVARRLHSTEITRL
jgi:succinyl-CoA synthetase alpha subunit